MNPPRVHINVALALLRQFLSGYRGYPNTQAGEHRFAEAVQSNAISVEHAEAFLKVFDGVFPTVREINDVAFTSRAKFEADALAEERKKWEREFGKPAAFRLYPPDTMAMHWQAFRDSLYYHEGPGHTTDEGFWGRAFAENQKCHPDSMAFVRKQIQNLGWPEIMKLIASPNEGMPYTNPLDAMRKRKVMPHIAAPIAQAEIDEQLAKRALPPPSDDSWEDPDR